MNWMETEIPCSVCIACCVVHALYRSCNIWLLRRKNIFQVCWQYRT